MAIGDSMQLYDVAAKQTLFGMNDDKGNPSIRDLALHPSGNLVAWGSLAHNLVKRWDLAARRELPPLEGHPRSVNAVAFSPDGKLLASGGNRMVRLWDVATGATLHITDPLGDEIIKLCFSPDSKMLAAARGNQVWLWEIGTDKEPRILRGFGGFVRAIAFSPDGRTLATTAADGTLRLWDPQSGKEYQLFRLGPPGGDLASVAFTTDSRYLATGNGNGTVYILRLASRR